VESIDTAPFGRTGHESSRVIFGAAALWRMSQQSADVILQLLFEFGVNHLDVAADYGDAELRMRPWLADHRGRFFVATKTGERTADGAREELERSLERLGVDRVDLVQLHNLVEEDEWQVAHGPGGALEGLFRAREEGLVGEVGVTGHGLRIASMHLRSLQRADFASVLFPYSYVLSLIDTYRADVEELLEVCTERNVAVQTIKAVARRRWGGDDGARFSWYEPCTDGEVIGRAVRHVLANEQLFLNSSSDARLLRPTLEAACSTSSVGQPSASELDADVEELAMEPLFDGNALERI
jgi:aryl-alcohol dehydrogenase-like predicted oxidoreductase